jgi:hypothetical protein
MASAAKTKSSVPAAAVKPSSKAAAKAVAKKEEDDDSEAAAAPAAENAAPAKPAVRAGQAALTEPVAPSTVITRQTLEKNQREMWLFSFPRNVSEPAYRWQPQSAAR